MPTVAEPLWDHEAATPEQQVALPPTTIDIERQLLVVSLVARLQRVVTNYPGDREFIRAMRGKRPEILSEPQLHQVVRLAWRYRFQLPPGLRPGSDPDKAEPRSN